VVIIEPTTQGLPAIYSVKLSDLAYPQRVSGSISYKVSIADNTFSTSALLSCGP
jgi:hypothetical protein